MKNSKKNIVISGINIKSGGPLTIFYGLLDYLLNEKILNDYNITVFCNNIELFKKYDQVFNIIDFKKSNISIIHRFYYEYIYFKRISQKLNIHLWISLNDKTPNVHSDYQLTYCHNATMFYKCSLKDIFYNPMLLIYSLFYRFLYRINIKKNNILIVQQKWIAEEFKKIYKLNNIVISKPTIRITEKKEQSKINEEKTTSFIYPTTPRTYKNIEILYKAIKVLEKNNLNYKLYLTITGNENRYSKYIRKLFKENTSVKFLGYLKKEKLYEYYYKSHAMIFPSKLETWGLPLTEYSKLNKTIFSSNLEYAKETLNEYEKAIFFDPNNYVELSSLLMKFINKEKMIYSRKKNNKYNVKNYSWKEIIDNFNRSQNEKN